MVTTWPFFLGIISSGNYDSSSSSSASNFCLFLDPSSSIPESLGDDSAIFLLYSLSNC
jgi:hypothetical protein